MKKEKAKSMTREVKGCVGCPSFEISNANKVFCEAVYKTLEGYKGEIPDWCPLPDNVEEPHKIAHNLKCALIEYLKSRGFNISEQHEEHMKSIIDSSVTQ